MAVVLSKGSRGELVKRLQAALNLVQDGIFGAVTEEAVKAFQKANGLKPDGIVGEKTWSKLPSASALNRSRRLIKEIIVHCTATPEGRVETVESIRLMHKKQGWADIGYHYLVYLDGSVHNGRPVDKIGAHCYGHNTYSIGVAYVGGVDKAMKSKDTRTDKQKSALKNFLKELRRIYPKAKIYGHCDFSDKDCPSFNAMDEYKNI